MPAPSPAPLPIDPLLPDLCAALAARGRAVLLAPPGAGKTTRVPGAILDAGLSNKRIVVLQPRRVAARAAARRIAHERGVRLGAEVGYRVRFDDRTSAETRIELLTEGLLTRRLQSDPFLEDIGCVIFDEFHERSLHADLGLALVREVCEARPELKLVVMSATLDPGPVAEWLDAPVLTAQGRAFPVEVEHIRQPDDRRLPDRCAAAIRATLARPAERPGHVLVFLPGVGEIEATADALGPLPDVDVLPLHGRLPAAAQDKALAPQTRRKVVLATNIAETSVTIDGVTTVIDSGEARVPRFDPAIGLERLERGRISRASADQRAGRAGRTAPGRCLRLWTASEHRGLQPYEAPAITRVDLTRTVLELRAWGADPQTFDWFEAPPAGSIERAEALLQRLGALDERGVTARGEALLALPVHPRLGMVVLTGKRNLRAAAAVAALAAERDIFFDPPEITAHSDLELRLDAMDSRRTPRGVNRRALGEVRRARDQLVRIAEKAPLDPDALPADAPPARLLLAGFPDRVAQRRAPRSDRFKLSGGGGARLSARSAVRDAPLIVAVSLRGGRRGERAEHTIETASAVDPAWLPIESAIETRFDPQREAVVQVEQRRYLTLVLDEVPAGRSADRDAVSAALAEAAAADPRAAFGWPDDPATAGLIARLRWLAGVRPEWDVPTFPDLDPHDPPSDLIRTLCDGRRSFAELRRVKLAPMLDGLLSHQARGRLSSEAPPRLTLPDGTTRAVEYTPGEPPVLATRFERLFGLTETPRLAGAPIKLHLLAPNRRPVQITDDLASFWATTYPQVRKELRGRYPKHPWPEDPLTATPGIHRRRRR